MKQSKSEINKRYWRTERAKLTRKRYRSSPEGIAAQDRYRSSPKGREADKRYDQSQKGKLSRRPAKEKYRKTPKGAAYVARYRKSEKRQATRRRYNQSQKGKGASLRDSALRRSRKRQAGVKLDGVPEIYARCAELRQLGFDVVVDHKIPLSVGGSHTAGNLQIIYSEENKRKGNRVDYTPSVIFT